jgi:hypothetical protein
MPYNWKAGLLQAAVDGAAVSLLYADLLASAEKAIAISSISASSRISTRCRSRVPGATSQPDFRTAYRHGAEPAQLAHGVFFRRRRSA